MSAPDVADTLPSMSDGTKRRLDLAASWANRPRDVPMDVDLANGRTRRVEWAGKSLRLRVRAGRHGPRLDLLPSHGSRLWSLGVLVFLSVHWLGFGGAAIGWLLRSLRAEIPDPVQIGVSIVVALALNLIYVPFFWAVLDEDWSFEPNRATRRLSLLGCRVWQWTYCVVGVSEAWTVWCCAVPAFATLPCAHPDGVRKRTTL